MKKLKKILFSRWILGVIIAIFTIVSYANILGNGFVWDDTDFIVNWKATRRINLIEYFQGVTPKGHEGVYRPIRTIMYSLAFKLFQTKAFWYHLHGILLHILISLVVYDFLSIFTERKRLSFFASLLFALHPAHTESVSFATINFDLYAALFFFLSLSLYLKAQKTGSYAFYFFSLLSTSLAFLSGEMALTIPLVIILVHIFKNFTETKLSKKIVSRYISIYYILGFAYVVIRFFILKVPTRANAFWQYPSILRVLFLKVFLRYLYILFIPLNLNTSYKVIPEESIIIKTSSSNIWLNYVDYISIFSFLLILVFLIIAKQTRKRHPLVSFSIFWFFITILPFSNLIPTGAAIADRYLYIPSLGWALGVSYLLIYIYNKPLVPLHKYWQKTLTVISLTLVVILFSIRIIYRNLDWKDSFSLWSKTVKDSPGSSLAHNNLGKAYVEKKDYEKAILSFQTAINIYPEHLNAHKNLGAVYTYTKQYDKAIRSYEKALTLSPSEEYIIEGLSSLFLAVGEDEKAKEMVDKLLKEKPNAQIYNIQGMISMRKGDINASITSFQKAIETDPQYSKAYNNLAAVYMSQGNWQKATELLEKASLINADDPDIYYNLGGAYLGIKNIIKAIDSYEKALELNPDFEKAKEALSKLQFE